MKCKSKINITGRMVLEVIDIQTGKLKDRRHVKNLVVDDGLEVIVLALIAEALEMTDTIPDNQGFQYCAVGDKVSPAAPANDDTDLQQELVSGGRVVNSYIFAEGASIIIDSFFGTTEGNGSLTEAGLFGYDATAVKDSGMMITRTTFDTITKTSSETMTISWSLTFSRS